MRSASAKAIVDQADFELEEALREKRVYTGTNQHRKLQRQTKEDESIADVPLSVPVVPIY